MSSYFITATDTDAGKTYVTVLLYRYALAMGLSPAVFKPIASGCKTPGQPASNPDLAELQQLNSAVPLQLINCWCFDAAIAPHIAAEHLDTRLCLQQVAKNTQALYEARKRFSPFDIAFFEGAGGWMLPINLTETLDQWVVTSSTPRLQVILVVGMKIGCINHALLTAQQFRFQGAVVVGWIANSPVTMECYADNLKTLEAMLPFPLLAEVRYNQTTINSAALRALFLPCLN